MGQYQHGSSLIRISKLMDQKMNVGPSPADLFGYSTKQDETVYHIFTDYEPQCTDVIIDETVQAIKKTDQNVGELLINDRIVECEIKNIIDLELDTPLYLYGMKRPNASGFSLELRGIVSESIFGWKRDNKKNIEFLGENIDPTIINDTFTFSEFAMDISGSIVHPADNDIGDQFAPDTKTQVLEIDLNPYRMRTYMNNSKTPFHPKIR